MNMRWIWWLLLGTGVLALGAVVAQRAEPRPVAETDLPGTAVPMMASTEHIAYMTTPHEPYTTVPPTSGPHVPFTVAPGVYTWQIPEEIQVHALEHGHVLIQYAATTPPDQIEQLTQIARQYPRDVVVAPYHKLETGVALTAWCRIQRLERVESEQIAAFVVALRGRYNHGWRR